MIFPSFKNEMSAPNEDVTMITSHKKFLLIPMIPPMFDIIVIASFCHDDFVK